MTALELLDKEIKKLQISLEYAKIKPNSREEELANIREKLELKREIREIVQKEIIL